MTAEHAAAQFGAQLYLPLPEDPTTAQLYYRWHTTVRPTGEPYTTLEYLSYCNLWQGSFAREQEKLVARLLPIPGAPQHDPKAAYEGILAEELERLGADEFARLQAKRAANKEAER